MKAHKTIVAAGTLLPNTRAASLKNKLSNVSEAAPEAMRMAANQ